MTKEFKTYERLIIETNNEYLFDIFGDGGESPKIIDEESIEYLADYLYEYDEDDEDDKPKIDDKDVKAMFDFISDKLKRYKEVQVVRNK